MQERKQVSLNLQEIANKSDSMGVIETPNTGLKLEVTALPYWVRIEPQTKFTGLSPDIFVLVTVAAKERIIELAVYTKRSNGSYFDNDFRAKPLTREAVEFILKANPDAEGIGFEYREGSQTFTEYDRERKRLIAQGKTERDAENLAPKGVWDYIHIASPLGFTQITDVTISHDSDSGRIAKGVFRKTGKIKT